MTREHGVAERRAPGAGSERPQVVQIIVSPHMRANGKPHRSYFDCRVVIGSGKLTHPAP